MSWFSRIFKRKSKTVKGRSYGISTNNQDVRYVCASYDDIRISRQSIVDDAMIDAIVISTFADSYSSSCGSYDSGSYDSGCDSSSSDCGCGCD